jgi:hypothetical protein
MNYVRRCWHCWRERRLDALGYLRGWTERDIEALENALNDPRSYDGGIVKLTRLQFTALEERNRRVAENKRTLKISPLLVWVKGRGLFPAVKKD